MVDSPDMEAAEDLRDVFKLMYEDEDDWEVEEDDHPPLDSLVPDIQLELQPVLAPVEEEDDYFQRVYSKKRFRTQLDSLLPTTSTSKKRRIFPSNPQIAYYPSTTPLPLLPAYTAFEPYNPLAYLARLRTYHPSLYSPFLPVAISPARLAGNGWFCAMRDGVECGLCGAKWGVGGLIDIKDGRVREEIGRRLGEGMGERHGKRCGWRVLSSPNDMTSKLRNILHTPIASNIAPLASTLPSNLVLKSRISEKQINHLTFALSRYTTTSRIQAELAFFGWSTHPLSSDILQCRICQRRLGLWAFASGSGSQGDKASAGEGEASRKKEGLDPVGEHLGWCPLNVEGWWDECALLKGARGNVGDLSVSKGVKRMKWIKA